MCFALYGDKNFFTTCRKNGCKYKNTCICFSVIPAEFLINVSRLDCSECTLIKEIPVIKGLEQLYCNNCPNLTIIPFIDSLVQLECCRCFSLTSISDSQSGLKLRSEPQSGLKYLSCYTCPNLTNIPILPKLEWFECQYCPKLKSIPFLENLYSLNCNECSITTIPKFQKLRALRCRFCPITKIPVKDLYYVDDTGCRFLNNTRNFKYKSIKKVQYLQKWLGCLLDRYVIKKHLQFLNFV